MSNDLDQQERTAVIQGLRDLATFLESKPGLPMPYSIAALISVHAHEIPAIVREIGNSVKTFDEKWAGFKRNFGGNVHYEIFTARENVCKRVVVGKRQIPAVTIEAHDQDIVEWDCGGSVFARSADKEERDDLRN